MVTYTISFRFQADLYDFSLFDEYILSSGLDMLQSSMGLHEQECNTKHYHYHLITSNKFAFKSPPTQNFKNKHPQLTQLFKDNPNSISIKCQESTQDHSTCDDGENPMTNQRFLNYPLKEKKPVETYCRNINIEQSCLEGNAEWKSAMVYKAKKLARELKDKSKKVSLWNYLDTQNFNLSHTVRDVAAATHNYYLTQEDAPHYYIYFREADKYAVKRGILTAEELLDKIYGKDPMEKTNKLLAEYNT